MSWKRLLVPVAVLAVAFGAMLGAVLMPGSSGSQASTPTPTPSPETTTTPDDGDDGESTPTEMQARVDEYLALLAEKLGVDVDQLRGALKDTALELIDRAVAAGEIDEALAEELRARVEEGKLPLGPAHFRRGWRGHHGFDGFGHRGHGFGLKGIGVLGAGSEELAEFLGLTTDELRERVTDGESLATIAEAQGKTRDELTTFLLDQANAAIDAALEDGRITESMAEQVREGLDAKIDRVIDSEFSCPSWPDGSSDDNSDATDSA